MKRNFCVSLFFFCSALSSAQSLESAKPEQYQIPVVGGGSEQGGGTGGGTVVVFSTKDLINAFKTTRERIDAIQPLINNTNARIDGLSDSLKNFRSFIDKIISKIDELPESMIINQNSSNYKAAVEQLTKDVYPIVYQKVLEDLKRQYILQPKTDH
jgi:hypothetical protein